MKHATCGTAVTLCQEGKFLLETVGYKLKHPPCPA